MRYKFKTSINDQIWVCHLVSQRTMTKLCDGVDDAAGLTIGVDKCIYILDGHVNLNTIIHELVHAYAENFNIEGAELTPLQLEEMFANFFGNNLNSFVMKCNELVDKYTQLEEKKSNAKNKRTQ